MTPDSAVPSERLPPDFVEDLRSLVESDPAEVKEYARLALRFATEPGFSEEGLNQAIEAMGIEPEKGERLIRVVHQLTGTEANTDEPHSDTEKMLMEIARQAEGFERIREQLESEYFGKYVVVLDGELLDSDMDLLQLQRRVLPQLKKQKRHAILEKIGAPPVRPSMPPSSWLLRRT